MPPDRAHIDVRLVAEIQIGHHFVNPVIVVAQAEIARLQPQAFTYGEEWIEDQFLRNDAQSTAGLAKITDNIVSHHFDVARVCAGKASHDQNQRGFARAIGANRAKTPLVPLAGRPHPAPAIACSVWISCGCRATDMNGHKLGKRPILPQLGVWRKNNGAVRCRTRPVDYFTRIRSGQRCSCRSGCSRYDPCPVSWHS